MFKKQFFNKREKNRDFFFLKKTKKKLTNLDIVEKKDLKAQPHQNQKLFLQLNKPYQEHQENESVKENGQEQFRVLFCLLRLMIWQLLFPLGEGFFFRKEIIRKERGKRRKKERRKFCGVVNKKKKRKKKKKEREGKKRF